MAFCPDECKLTPLGLRGTVTVLHAPMSRFLLLLLQHPGEVVRQDLIFREVWEKHGQLVTANTLYQNVSLLRKGLRSAGLINSTIKTIPKIGFIFKGKVQVIEEESDNAPPTSLREERPSQPSEVPLVETSPIKPTWRRVVTWRRLIHVVYFVVFVTMGYFLLRETHERREQFVYAHSQVARINQCNVYVDRQNFKANWNKYIVLLRDKGISCRPQEFIYITKTQAKEDVIVLFCYSGSESGLQCSTRFKITDNIITSVGY